MFMGSKVASGIRSTRFSCRVNWSLGVESLAVWSQLEEGVVCLGILVVIGIDDPSMSCFFCP